ncbi:hypothetical protein R1flu_027474 [Riccia fluitans]|uniref:Death domain-containing protein n=1 Tax=Riccia fluitans TaxID=41844 RepID=A0ABD1XJ03_9MARC
MWEVRCKEALEQLEEKALLLGLTHHECQKMIDIFESWINPNDDQKLIPLVGKLHELNYDPDVELRSLEELQDGCQSPQMDDQDYMREMTTEERVELRTGVVMNYLTIRSRIRALNFDGSDDEDEVFNEEHEEYDYRFTLAQMITMMISPISGLRPMVSLDVPILKLVSVAPPSLEPYSQVPTNNISILGSSKPQTNT